MQMRVCKLCFKNIKNNTLVGFLNPNLSLCSECYKRLKPQFIQFFVSSYEGLAFYYYDQDIRALLYQFKGCFDYELARTFLDRYFGTIRLKYLGYTIVPVPSFKEDDERREFNHVEEIFRHIKLPMKKILVKTAHFKQAEHNSRERKEIKKHMAINGKPDIHNLKILIVDDVFTTGSTMRTAIKLVESLKPKDIKVLVMSKTRDGYDYN